ncbi:hypothetical protein JR065_20835 [Xanthomonas sp. AmX2]|uniref:hypothetical protein n=1 Tax=Xanthomonas sp. TaxID=29446 RepID=UPI001980CEF2|nr:hypothetical protein [Xanthomonas sp.]MBN6152780.1 hypothetical protein [Xanthomonas sp.]
MTFSPTFILLQQEAYLARGSLSAGLTSLRNATFPDKGAFYPGFFNTSIGFERVMKLIVVVDHMLQNGYAPPSKAQLKAYGHDLVTLYSSCVAAAQRIGLSAVRNPVIGSTEEKILAFLSEFARWSRYYNLDSLQTAPSTYTDPLATWDAILESVLATDVPSEKARQKLQEAQLTHDLLANNVRAIQHGMSGKLLSLPEVFSTPVKHQLAVPYAMARVFRLLTPLLQALDELGCLAFYGPPRPPSPQAPLFSEFFVHFRGTDAEIRRKKRWP